MYAIRLRADLRSRVVWTDASSCQPRSKVDERSRQGGARNGSTVFFLDASSCGREIQRPSGTASEGRDGDSIDAEALKGGRRTGRGRSSAPTDVHELRQPWSDSMSADTLLAEMTSTSLLSVINAVRHDAARTSTSVAQGEGEREARANVELTTPVRLPPWPRPQLLLTLGSHLWMICSSMLVRGWRDS